MFVLNAREKSRWQISLQENKASAYPIKAIFDTKNWKFGEKFKILDTVYLERGKNTDLYTQNKKILKNRE